MGGGKRDKFSRYESNSEDESSEEEISTLVVNTSAESEGKEDQPEVNENNSNSKTENRSNLKNSGDQLDGSKYLETRSKRKYTKPQIPFDILSKRPKSQVVVEESKSKENCKQKLPRQTIKSLDQRIQQASTFLEQLNERISERDEEIKKLKQIISNTRVNESVSTKQNVSVEIPNNYKIVVSEEENSENDEQNDQDDIQLDLQVAVRAADDIESMDDGSSQEIVEKKKETRPAPREHERYRSEKRKSRSRSRSRSRSKKAKRNKSNDYEYNKKYYFSENEVTDEDMETDPKIQKLVKRMVEDRIEEEVQKRMKLTKPAGMDINASINQKIPINKVKSPSEPTLYTPAIRRMERHLNASPSVTQIAENYEDSSPKLDSQEEQINNRISNLRLIAAQKDGQPDSRRQSAGEPRPSTSQKDGHDGQQARNARKVAEEAILEAERFRASIQQPNKGIQFNNGTNTWNKDQLRYLRYLECEDDEFFHTTCHIDVALKEKIEKGLFVELDKLLQKKLQSGPSDNRLQLINKDGASFFVPPIDRETRVDSIKKWEQAFRVYTTIYCHANPTRAGEILQYTDIIHRAAATFSWDNVAKYDYVFRQLMAEKPYRSWAKVYTQMWNITLNEPIKKFNEYSSNSNGSKASGNSKRKDSYCWKFNKSNNCPYGKNCKFEHKCSYCGNQNHSFQNCLKRNGKKNHSSGTDKKTSSSS